MEVDRARYLVSRRGREALAGLPGDLPLEPNRLAAALRRSFEPAEASALAEQVTLRSRAERHHGSHRGLLYTAAGLEMMTHPAVAARRAERLAGIGPAVIDLTCGIGGDLRAVVEAGVPAAGLEADPATALIAAANTGPASIAVGRAERAPFDTRRFAVIIDPSRREGGARRFDPGAFSPRWDVAVALAQEAAAAVLKAPPGLDSRHIPPDPEVEAVQLGTSMRELSLWFGTGAAPGLRRAVLLPSGASIASDEPEGPAETRAPGAFLFDPESCVTRATLVRHLAARLDGWLLDPQVAYLSAGAPAFSPLAATFEVLDVVPFSVARMKERLRERSWRPEEVRRRAFPVEPDELRRLLGRIEGEPVTLLLTTISGKRLAFVARRLFAPR